MHTGIHSTRRMAVTFAAAAGLVVAALIAPSAGSAAPLRGADAQPSKIMPDLAGQLASGTADYWVRFDATADLTAASQMSDHDARGQAVYDELTKVADASQAPVRAFLASDGATYQPFWAVNAIYVTNGTFDLARSLSSFTHVATIQAPLKAELIKPMPGISQPKVDGVEWGVANINADDVWALGDRGKGIVVASIDTGTQYNHPALVKQYRGKKKHGKFNHNYNWLDTSGSAQAPFDNNGHGTHTMGTMVGDDGGANQIGVAPKAKWIEANGCNTCSESDLIQAGQWMLAPTKLDGTKPKTKKRPDIVNNSWGYQSPGQQTLFDAIIADWDASGIFGQWANGNIGPGCSTSGAPGSRPQAYSSGAYDINNTIAGFSSRGPGLGADIKPNISAPGVNVRSSLPGSTYGAESGTSMASPHVAGAIALLWSAVPSLERDIAGTKAALDGTATDKADAQCGGTAADNNVYGEGRLDALTLVQDAIAATTPAVAVRNTN